MQVEDLGLASEQKGMPGSVGTRLHFPNRLCLYQTSVVVRAPILLLGNLRGTVFLTVNITVDMRQLSGRAGLFTLDGSQADTLLASTPRCAPGLFLQGAELVLQATGLSQTVKAGHCTQSPLLQQQDTGWALSWALW